jgi:hypothetical protein
MTSIAAILCIPPSVTCDECEANETTNLSPFCRMAHALHWECHSDTDTIDTRAMDGAPLTVKQQKHLGGSSGCL